MITVDGDPIRTVDCLATGQRTRRTSGTQRAGTSCASRPSVFTPASIRSFQRLVRRKTGLNRARHAGEIFLKRPANTAQVKRGGFPPARRLSYLPHIGEMEIDEIAKRGQPGDPGLARRPSAIEFTLGFHSPNFGVIISNEGLAQGPPLTANPDTPAAGFLSTDRSHFLGAKRVQ